MSAQEKFDKHVHLSEAPTDSVLVLEFWIEGKKASKTRRRTFISFNIDELREMRIVVKGRKKLTWTPVGEELDKTRCPVQIPKPMVAKIEKIIKNHPELYNSSLEFIETAIRQKIEAIL